MLFKNELEGQLFFFFPLEVIPLYPSFQQNGQGTDGLLNNCKSEGMSKKANVILKRA